MAKSFGNAPSTEEHFLSMLQICTQFLHLNWGAIWTTVTCMFSDLHQKNVWELLATIKHFDTLHTLKKYWVCHKTASIKKTQPWCWLGQQNIKENDTTKDSKKKTKWNRVKGKRETTRRNLQMTIFWGHENWKGRNTKKKKNLLKETSDLV
jgi:hypothetical protein